MTPEASAPEPGARPNRASVRLIQVLQRPLLPLWLALLGMLLTLPALRAGLIGDDLYHRSVLTGARVFNNLPPSPLNMFRFFDGDEARTMRMIDLGTVPWFAWPGAKGGFWRPLTVLTHWLDYRLWPNWPVLMHAQSVLWFGAVIIVVTLFYRRMLVGGGGLHFWRRRLAGEDTDGTPVPHDGHSVLPWVAGLAALLYTIDDARGLPVGFLANRNTLVCAFFGVLALLAHDRWRRTQSGAGVRHGESVPAGQDRPGTVRMFNQILTTVTGPALLVLSLLAKEEGLGACAYLLAYAVFLDRGSWRRRVLSLAPYAAVVIAWRIVWTGLGYGVQDVGFYVDPLREPLRFARAVFERGPLLLLGQWGLPPPEVTLLLGTLGRTLLWGAAVLFLSGVAWVLYPLIRGSRPACATAVERCGAVPREQRNLACFWALGMLLAVLPICTTFPADRMLSFVGLGAMGLLAQFLGALTQYAARSRSVMRAALIGVHLIIAPIMLPLRAGWPTGPWWSELALRAPLDDGIACQDLVLVNPPSVMHVAYYIVERDFAGLPVPRHIRQLASGPSSLTMHRLDERTLEIRPKNGYGGWAFERLFRTERHPFRAGDRIELTGMSIEITVVTPDGRPAVARFQFAVPLEDASLRWLAYEQREFRPYAPPQVGETIELSGW